MKLWNQTRYLMEGRLTVPRHQQIDGNKPLVVEERGNKLILMPDVFVSPDAPRNSGRPVKNNGRPVFFSKVPRFEKISQEFIFI